MPPSQAVAASEEARRWDDCRVSNFARGSRVSRRAILLSGLVGATSACGIRLERDLPPHWLKPPPDPAIALLHNEVKRVRAAGRLVERVAGRVESALAPLHAKALQALLTELHSRNGEESAPATPSAESTALPSPTRQDVRAAEAAGLDEPGRAALASSPAEVARLLLASHAQRGIAYGLLGGRLGGWPATSAPPQGGETLHAALHSAVYGLEIATARTPAQMRAPLSAALAAVQREETLYLANSPPRSRLGYSLPFEVRTPADARRLAVVVLDTLVDAVLWQAPNAVGIPVAATRTPASGAEPATSTATQARDGPVVDPRPMATLLRLTLQFDSHRRSCGGALELLSPLHLTSSPSPAGRES